MSEPSEVTAPTVATDSHGGTADQQVSNANDNRDQLAQSSSDDLKDDYHREMAELRV